MSFVIYTDREGARSSRLASLLAAVLNVGRAVFWLLIYAPSLFSYVTNPPLYKSLSFPVLLFLLSELCIGGHRHNKCLVAWQKIV